MALERYTRALAGPVETAQLENQLRRQASIDAQNRQMNELNMLARQLEVQQSLQPQDPYASSELRELGAGDYGEAGLYRVPKSSALPPLRVGAVGKKKEEDDKAFDREFKLSESFMKQSGDFIKQRDAFGRIQASASDPSAAGDLALIFNYMKVLDPGSTVREGEFANAQNAGGVEDRVVSMYNRVMRGERLSPEQRRDFVDRSQRLYTDAERQQKKREGVYSQRAERYGLNPANVISDISYSPQPVAPQPKVVRPTISAPENAVQYLMQNNTPEMRKAFQDKYGYLPEGM